MFLTKCGSSVEVETREVTMPLLHYTTEDIKSLYTFIRQNATLVDLVGNEVDAALMHACASDDPPRELEECYVSDMRKHAPDWPVMAMSLNNVPRYINSERPITKAIVKWRLSHGK